jgi:hypothetical protein
MLHGVSDTDAVVGELAVEAPDLSQEVAGQRLALDVDHRSRVDAGEDPGCSFGP